MKLLLVFALPMVLAAADLKIDHATVCGVNVDAMRKALIGVANLPSEYGGMHSNHATEMALVSFPDGSYLELMGIQAKPDPAAVAAHVWSKFLRNDAGPCAFALRVTDINAEVVHLKSAGIPVGNPERAGRTRPDGIRLEWETLDEGSGPRGSLLPFLIRDFTPRENRAFPSGKPTTTEFGGIGKVVVGVRDLDGAIAQYRKAFGLPAPRREKDARFEADLAWFEGTPIVLATGLSESSWLTRRVRDYGDAPVAFVLKATHGVVGSGIYRHGSAIRSSGWMRGDWDGVSELNISAILLAAAIAAAQQAPPEPMFHAGTELVQVNVIAQDKQSKPVADLRREEFQIFDNGAPQEVRLFQAETEKSEPLTPQVNAPNTFSNRIVPQTGLHSGYSVIVIDNLYSDFGDPNTDAGSGWARLQTLRTLRSMPAGERIAIYAQGRKLQVICEFTSDRDLLERQLGKWRPQVDAPDISTEVLAIPAGRFDTGEMRRSREAAVGEGKRIDLDGRVFAGDEEMGLVADHLAGIPGRKKLIWLSNKFIVGSRALEKLNAAGVSIYPVDIDGVCGNFQRCAQAPRPTQLMDGIAALTGGVASYLRNDIDIAIREAIDDGRVSYTLGFYPSEGGRAATVHQLTVKVSRPDVTLRYRTSYRTEAPLPAAEATKAELAKALNRPIDATTIPVNASVRRVRDRLNVEAAIDVESLGLVPDRGLWIGTLKVGARFTTADGTVAGDPFAQTVTLNLRQATYEKAIRGGLTYHNELKILAGAVELKLLFANPASGKIGTLTIPLSKVAPVA